MSSFIEQSLHWHALVKLCALFYPEATIEPCHSCTAASQSYNESTKRPENQRKLPASGFPASRQQSALLRLVMHAFCACGCLFLATALQQRTHINQVRMHAGAKTLA